VDCLVPPDAIGGRLRGSRDRSKQTCLRLWESIPLAYRQGHCFTDFWAAYRAVIAFRTAYGGRQRDRGNRSCGALE
jgi:hypothetical protein